MNEAETRAEHIDPALKGAGWGVVLSSRVLREHCITQGRPGEFEGPFLFEDSAGDLLGLLDHLVAAVAEAYPDKHLLLTEATVEKFDPTRYQYWPNAERYGSAMINDPNHGAVGWTDWNMLLDETGGPNHVGNYCFSPIHADTRIGELIYTPSYYYIGHFSKFIRPDAQRVSSASSRSNLLATAFLNVDDTLATVVMNPTDKAITYNFYVVSAAAQVEIPAHGIQTLVSP